MLTLPDQLGILTFYLLLVGWALEDVALVSTAGDQLEGMFLRRVCAEHDETLAAGRVKSFSHLPD